MTKKPNKRPSQAEKRDFQKKLLAIEEFLPKVSRMGSAFPIPWERCSNSARRGLPHQEHTDKHLPQTPSTSWGH